MQQLGTASLGSFFVRRFRYPYGIKDLLNVTSLLLSRKTGRISQITLDGALNPSTYLDILASGENSHYCMDLTQAKTIRGS